MGKLVLVCRLAARDLRHRPAQAVLLLVIIAAAAAALTLGLVLRGVTDQPYQQTMAATAGPDVVASSVGYRAQHRSTAAVLGELEALTRAPGVTGHSGPYPVAWPVLRFGASTADVMAEGRGSAPAAADQPAVTAGTWLRGSGVVVERAFAEDLGIGVGDTVTLDGRPLRVTGIAVTSAVPVFTQVCFYGGCSGPGSKPRSFDTGLVWVTQAAARSLATPGNPLTYYLNLRLQDPAGAPAFVSEHQPPAGPYLPALTAWQSLSQASGTLVAQAQRVMGPASWLLSLLAVASVAVVAGARMAAQEKRVGLLKAVGATPSLAAAVLLAEHFVVALAAAGCGLAAGWLTAPLLSSPGASLLGTPGAPALSLATILLVLAAGIAVAVVATAIPALRAARISTVTALADAARPPRRAAWLIRVSSWLPVPLLLGVRMLIRRPRRVLLSAASFTVTATAIVAVMVFHATMSQQITLPGPYAGPPDPGNARVSQILLVVTVVLAVLAAANAIITTWATVLDTRRYWATARALGTTPQQVIVGLSAAQALPALAGALLGIPAGTELYALVQGAGYRGSPPSWWLLAMVAGMLLAAASLTAIPARIGMHHPVSEILQAEAP